jgi:hypothetical protein
MGPKTKRRRTPEYMLPHIPSNHVCYPLGLYIGCCKLSLPSTNIRHLNIYGLMRFFNLSLFRYTIIRRIHNLCRLFSAPSSYKGWSCYSIFHILLSYHHSENITFCLRTSALLSIHISLRRLRFATNYVLTIPIEAWTECR